MLKGLALISGLFMIAAWASGQEARSGFDLMMTVSGSASATQSDGDFGYRAVLYPMVKLNQNWSAVGVFQLNSAYSFSGANPPSDYLAKGYLLQGFLNYTLTGTNKSLVVRAGKIATAFGSYLLRYDDLQNPLIDSPMTYGYYYAPVSILGVTGVEADAAWNKWDARVQLANSSPANPRSTGASDQYGNWAAGAGYSVRQGLRIGVSGYYGPYLDRQSPLYSPGEGPPAHLKARAVGADVAWAFRHWYTFGEWQRFVFPYDTKPTFREHAGYFEVKRVVNPRWYFASRTGYTDSRVGMQQTLDFTAGYRPAASALLKLGYEWNHRSTDSPHSESIVMAQLAISLHPISLPFR